MKKTNFRYKYFDRAVIRTPLFPLDALRRPDDYLTSKTFQEAVFIASPEMFRAKGIVANDKGKAEKGYDIYISDPACGLLKYDMKSFLKSWEIADKEGNSYGLPLLLEPTPEFFRDKDFDNDDKLSLRFLAKYVKPYHKYFAQVLLAMFTGSIISLIAPFLT